MKLSVYFAIFMIALVFFLWTLTCVEGGEVSQSLVKHRQKRYVAFPEGSTFILTLCLFFNTVIENPTIFYEGVNWGISYDLPNATTMQEAFKMFNKPALKRRQRRDLYNKLEVVLEKMGFEGKPCIYRALCEANRRNNRKNCLGEDIFKLFFRYPLSKLSFVEPEDHRLYHWAMRLGQEKNHIECSELFPECSLSIVHTILGFE